MDPGELGARRRGVGLDLDQVVAEVQVVDAGQRRPQPVRALGVAGVLVAGVVDGR